MTLVPNPVRVSDPIFFNNWAKRSQDGHEGHSRQRGYNTAYLNDPNKFVYDEFHRVDARGNLCARYLCEPERRTQYADGTSGVGNGRWWGIPSERRDIIVWNILERWRDDDAADRARMTFGFYCGSDGNGDQWSQSSHTATGVLSLDTNEGTEKFERSFLPWLDMGVLSEIWWDAGSRPDYLADCLNLLNDQLERYGLHGGIEAIPHTRDIDPKTPWPDDISWPGSAPCPLLCLSRFILDRDPSNRLSWPEDDEVHIMNTIHTRVNGLPGNLTRSQARNFTARNWIVGSWRPQQDNMVNLKAIFPVVIGQGSE